MDFHCKLNEGWKGELWGVYGGVKLGLNLVGYREPSIFFWEE